MYSQSKAYELYKEVNRWADSHSWQWMYVSADLHAHWCCAWHCASRQGAKAELGGEERDDAVATCLWIVSLPSSLWQQGATFSFPKMFAPLSTTKKTQRWGNVGVCWVMGVAKQSAIGIRNNYYDCPWSTSPVVFNLHGYPVTKGISSVVCEGMIKIVT